MCDVVADVEFVIYVESTAGVEHRETENLVSDLTTGPQRRKWMLLQRLLPTQPIHCLELRAQMLAGIFSDSITLLLVVFVEIPHQETRGNVFAVESCTYSKATCILGHSISSLPLLP